VILFDLPTPPGGVRATPASLATFYWIGLSRQLEARQLQVTIRPLAGDQARTEITMTGDLRTGVRRNVQAAKGIAGVLAGLTGAISGGLVIQAAAAVLVAGVTGVGVAAGVGAASLGWYRWLYRSTLEKSRGEMQRALDAIAGTVRAEEVFGARALQDGER
jgi:hypothetical protein